MAGKKRSVDRSQYVEIVATCDDGTVVPLGLAGDGTILGTLIGADSLDRKIIARLVGARRVVKVVLADEEPPPTKRK